ncbi:MAG: FliA/WhiG family RNA polymerase sigma factor [Cyanobacteria bacterium P01_H01_bin.74]
MAEAHPPAAKLKSKPRQSPDKKVETLQLWKSYKQAPENGKLREQIILNYLHLVRYVVSRMPITLPSSITSEDLVSYGTMGLMEAVERFDPERGLKFETYAVTRIRGSIIDQLRFQDWVPRGVKRRSKELSQAMQELEETLGRQPTDDELASKLGVTKKRLNVILSETQNYMVSLDDSLGNDGSGSSLQVLDMVEDKNSPDPQGEYEAEELKHNLIKAIAGLPEREKLLIALYYHENMTLKEIGEIISVSESRACQLHAQAILRLRNKLKSQ